MKKVLFLLCIITSFSQAQNILQGPPPLPGDFLGIVHQSNYDFKIVFVSEIEGPISLSDIGFTLALPAGVYDIVNVSGILGGRSWFVEEFDAVYLTNLGLGDGSLDVFKFYLPEGETIVSHTYSQYIDLVSFQVSNSPNSGVMEFLSNNSEIANGFGSDLNSFINHNGAGDWFKGYWSGLSSFNFSSLGLFKNELLNKIRVYPNPASIKLRISSSTELDKIELYNVLGEKVLTNKLTNETDVSRISNGLYFLNIYQNNKLKLVRKLIIKKD